MLVGWRNAIIGGRSDLSTSELIPEGKEEVERGRLMLPDSGRLIGGKVTGRLMTLKHR